MSLLISPCASIPLSSDSLGLFFISRPLTPKVHTSVLPTRRAPRPSGSGVRNGAFEAAADNGNVDFVYSFATWVMEVAEVGSAQTADRPRRRDHACRRRRRFLGPNPSHTPHTGPGSRPASSAGHARRNALPLPERFLGAGCETGVTFRNRRVTRVSPPPRLATLQGTPRPLAAPQGCARRVTSPSRLVSGKFVHVRPPLQTRLRLCSWRNGLYGEAVALGLLSFSIPLTPSADLGACCCLGRVLIARGAA